MGPEALKQEVEIGPWNPASTLGGSEAGVPWTSFCETVDKYREPNCFLSVAVKSHLIKCWKRMVFRNCTLEANQDYRKRRKNIHRGWRREVLPSYVPIGGVHIPEIAGAGIFPGIICLMHVLGVSCFLSPINLKIKGTS